MLKTAVFFLCAAALLLPLPSGAAESHLINIQPKGSQQLGPGAVVKLPDGRQAIIENSLSSGDWQTNLGIVISPQGIVRGDPANPAVVVVEPAAAPATPLVQPEEPAQSIAVPPIQAEQPVEPKTPEQTGEPPAAIVFETPQAQPATPEAPKEPARQDQLTLAQMLPLTQAKTPEKPAAEPKPQEKARTPEKPKEQPKNQPKKEQSKPKTGQELRIPPEAVKTGNLDFLEGCWQGTRPEYYSKRMIKECFCFGPAGKNGKRRVIDPIGHRMCIGASAATLSKNGVLSVTSQGAACDDGERWGQAEMVCRNSGPKTPCSWVFRDANNGRQAYSIPFVRVDSCGR